MLPMQYESVYNKKILKTKTKFYGDEATDFHDKEVPKVDSTYTCLAVLALDSIFEAYEKYYAQVHTAWHRSWLICDALRNLKPFVQFKKRVKHSWRSVNFSKVAGFSLTYLLACLLLYLLTYLHSSPVAVT